jgi:hypothetical protein
MKSRVAIGTSCCSGNALDKALLEQVEMSVEQRRQAERLCDRRMIYAFRAFCKS